MGACFSLRQHSQLLGLTQALEQMDNGRGVQVVADSLDWHLRNSPLDSAQRLRLLTCLCVLVESGVQPRSWKHLNIRLIPNDRVAVDKVTAVYKGKFRNQIIAVKVARDADKVRPHIRDMVLRTYLIHPSILLVRGVWSSKSHGLGAVMEYANKGNLREYTKNLGQPERLSLLIQVLEGLAFLHRLNLVHGNIKGSNVVVVGDGRAVISNLQTACAASSKRGFDFLSPSGSLSLRWAAPERVDGTLAEPSMASDIWSSGCLLYEILTSRLPFSECTTDAQVVVALQRQRLPRRPLPESREHISDALWDVIIQCWGTMPDRRPTCLRLLDTLRAM